MIDFVVDVYALFCRLLADLARLWYDKFCIQWLRPCMHVLERVINTTTTQLGLLERASLNHWTNPGP
jgi:hypothetical protein